MKIVLDKSELQQALVDWVAKKGLKWINDGDHSIVVNTETWEVTMKVEKIDDGRGGPFR